MADLKNFDGLWRGLRTEKEKQDDYLFEEHKNGDCDETCRWCDDIDNMVKYFAKQNGGRK